MNLANDPIDQLSGCRSFFCSACTHASHLPTHTHTRTHARTHVHT